MKWSLLKILKRLGHCSKIQAMKLFYIFYIANQFMNSDAFSMRSFARNSRKRIPEWLENGHFNGHFNDHRLKKSVRDSKVGDFRGLIEIFDLSLWNSIFSHWANSIFRTLCPIALWSNTMADLKDEESTVAKMKMVFTKSWLVINSFLCHIKIK